THLFVLSGALAVGGAAGIGAAVGVVLIDKDTEASIGTGAKIDALGTTGGHSGVLNGNFSGDDFDHATRHGVVVQATSSEDILHIVAAGGGGYVGVSGAVSVTLINTKTKAFIHGNNTLVNTLDQSDAADAQGVFVAAGDNVTIQTFMLGIAAGFVGIAG